MWKWILISLSVAFLGLVGWLYYREAHLILEQKPTAWLEDQKADCAVVLTGGPGRVRDGFDLLAQGSIQKLIISGVHPYAQLREIFPQWPFHGGLDEKDVILERRSGTTYGNAQQSLPIVEALHCRDIVLITSRLHMYRAERTFRANFPPDYPIYPRATVAMSYKPPLIDLLIESTKSLFYGFWTY